MSGYIPGNAKGFLLDTLHKAALPALWVGMVMACGLAVNTCMYSNLRDDQHTSDRHYRDWEKELDARQADLDKKEHKAMLREELHSMPGYELQQLLRGQP